MSDAATLAASLSTEQVADLRAAAEGRAVDARHRCRRAERLCERGLLERAATRVYQATPLGRRVLKALDGEAPDA